MVMVAHLRADGGPMATGHGGSVTSTEIAAHALFRCEYCKLISQSDLMGVHRYRTCTGLGAPIVSADSWNEMQRAARGQAQNGLLAGTG